MINNTQAAFKKEKLLKLGTQHFNASNFDSAIKTIKKLLKIAPNDFNGLQISALAHYRLGHLNRAKTLTLKAIQIKPQQTELYNTLGCIYKDSQQWELAEKAFDQAIQLNRNYDSPYYNLALLQHSQDKSILALDNYQRVVELNNNHTGALIGLVQILVARKKIQQAEHYFLKYIEQTPEDIVFQQHIANILMENAYLDIANTLAQSMLLQNPENTHALYIIGNFFAKKNDYELASKNYLQLLKLQPEHIGALQNLAFSYEKLQDLINAEKCYSKINSVNNDNLQAHCQLARIYRLQKKYAMANKHCSTMLKKWPQQEGPLFEYGTLLNEQGEFRLAENVFRKALEINEQYVEAWDNLGFCYSQRAKFIESITCYENAVAIDSKHNHVQMNLGLSLLVTGQLKEAWKHYFYRPRFLLPNDKLSAINTAQDFSKKRILIIRAQGIGDELLFLRFVKLLKQQGAWICYRCNSKIKTLIERLTYIDKVIGENEYAENIDLSYSVDDLPLLLTIDDITKIPPPIRLSALSNNLRKVKTLLPNTNIPTIGITWRAGLSTEAAPTTSVNLLSKEINLSQFLSMFDDTDAYYVILQRNPTDEEIAHLKLHFKDRLIDLNELNENLEDMLALLDLLDIYIGVSNTNMHLLATLGKSAHVLIPSPPEWRWLNEGSSPWMPGFECYRKSPDLSWEKCLTKAATNIKN